VRVLAVRSADARGHPTTGCTPDGRSADSRDTLGTRLPETIRRPTLNLAQPGPSPHRPARIRTPLQIGKFLRSGVHRGGHALRANGPNRHAWRRTPPASEVGTQP
jgi:hypothetical protein